jgi:hypothetical protein
MTPTCPWCYGYDESADAQLDLGCKDLFIFCVNSPNIATPYTSFAHAIAIASFLKYSDTNGPGYTPDSTLVVMTPEHDKCNSLDL